ncbi:MAG: hypothetical protein JWM25_798 [Thermoleophilia bacterium]|nr:hypothetical protein [Thermoleophilia bacterium]MCZ4496215.1 hypothetical protein [Thermoleophilia bacterium]
MGRYELREARRQAGQVRRWTRPFRIFAGTLLLLLALLVGWLPGPGFIPLALAGGFLLAGEVAWAARLLDRGEAAGRARLAAGAARRGSRRK